MVSLTILSAYAKPCWRRALSWMPSAPCVSSWRIRTSACATSSASCSACSSAGARRSSIPTSWRSGSRTLNRRSPKAMPKREGGPAGAPIARPGAAAEPRRSARAFAADRGGGRAGNDGLPMLFRADAPDRRGPLRAPRRHPDTLPSRRHPPAEVRLPRLPERRGAGAGAAAADRGGPADRADGGARAGGEVCGSCTALSPGADVRPARDFHRPIDARFLGGICGGRAEAAVAAVARPAACLGQAVRRRDHGAGARSGPRPDQDRLLLGNRPRRPAVGRRRSAGGDLLVRARTGERARGGPTKGLPRHPADRRLHRLQDRGQAPRHRRRDGRRGDPCALLGALPTAVLRDRAQGTGADRPRGPAADRGTVRDRGGDPRPERRTAAGPPAAADKAAARGDEALAAAAPRRAVAQIAAGRSDRLPAEPVERTDPLPRRRPDRDRFQHGRAFNETDCAQSQERTLCRPQPRCRELGGARLADRNLQVAQCESGSLARRLADPPRQWLAEPPPRRTHALGLESRPKHSRPRRRVNGSAAADQPRPSYKRQAGAPGAPLTVFESPGFAEAANLLPFTDPVWRSGSSAMQTRSLGRIRSRCGACIAA